MLGNLTKADALRTIFHAAITLEETDAVLVLALFAERLARGHEEHGALDLRSGSRNWQAEALDETLDRAIYLAFEDVAAVLRASGRAEREPAGRY